jgi:hypothetical protein
MAHASEQQVRYEDAALAAEAELSGYTAALEVGERAVRMRTYADVC